MKLPTLELTPKKNEGNEDPPICKMKEQESADGKQTMKCELKPQDNVSRYATLFDLLELCDTYVNILNRGGNGDDSQ